ncbi:MAG TPA: hypothetical protein VHC86_16570 [Opitutaceae bacterium]|nr:hypothetical protein [Opitutaceae bacterium]
MECRPVAFLALLTLLASGDGINAEEPDPPSPDVKAETLRLIQDDFQRAAAGRGASAPEPAATRDPDVIKLSPFVVTDRRIPGVVLPHYENRFRRFLREGTLHRTEKFELQSTFVPTRQPIGSTAKPGARFELSLQWRF